MPIRFVVAANGCVCCNQNAQIKIFISKSLEHFLSLLRKLFDIDMYFALGIFDVNHCYAFT
jgi:hypothetical protein